MIAFQKLFKGIDNWIRNHINFYKLQTNFSKSHQKNDRKK